MTLVVRAWRGAGFFACFNLVTNHLAHSLGRNGVEAIRVDWTGIVSFPYGPVGRNLWEDFFEPIHFNHFPPTCVETTRWADTRMTHVWAYYYLYRRGDSWRRQYHAILANHIRVRPHIREEAESFHRTRLSGYFVLGVHFRNPGHSVECPEPVPPIKKFVAKARQLLPLDREARIFLATDVEEAVEAFRAAFPDRLVVRTDLTRARTVTDREITECIAEPSVRIGEEVLIDALLLAKCDVLLHITSNIATAVGYINPDLKMVYCEDDPRKALASYWVRAAQMVLASSPRIDALARKMPRWLLSFLRSAGARPLSTSIVSNLLARLGGALQAARRGKVAIGEAIASSPEENRSSQLDSRSQ